MKLENRRFHAEKIGEIVTDRLTESFENLLDYDFTARMEETLDEVADGEKAWKLVLDEFYGDFKTKLETAEEKDGGMRPNSPVDTPIECPACGRHMQLRTASTGVFRCSGYTLPPKERCTKTLNLIPGDEAVDLDADEESESKALLGKRRCTICGGSMNSWLLDEKRKLHVWQFARLPGPRDRGRRVQDQGLRRADPRVRQVRIGDAAQVRPVRKVFRLHERGMQEHSETLRNGEPAPPKMDPVPMPELQCEKVEDTYVLGTAQRACSRGKPVSAASRDALRSWNALHRSEIDPKYTFLFDAPTEDLQGNPAVIRWSRSSRSSM